MERWIFRSSAWENNRSIRRKVTRGVAVISNPSGKEMCRRSGEDGLTYKFCGQPRSNEPPSIYFGVAMTCGYKRHDNEKKWFSVTESKKAP